MDELSIILHAFTKAGHVDKALYDALYDQTIDMLSNETCNLSIRKQQNGLTSIAKSFVTAGYHTLDNFPVILDYAFFNQAPNQGSFLKRLHEVADAVLLEAPENAEKCQYYDTIVAYKNHPACKTARTANHDDIRSNVANAQRQRSTHSI